METRIEVYKPVMVKLTDVEKENYYHIFDEINKKYGTKIKPSFPEEDADGYMVLETWMVFPDTIIPPEIVSQMEKQNEKP